MDTVATNKTFQTIETIALILVGLLFISHGSNAAVHGQESEFNTGRLPSAPTTIAPDGTFQSIEDGFKLRVPTGWAVKDIDNTIPAAELAETALQYTFLAIICGDHRPGLGGTNECNITPDLVTIMRIGELDQRPEIQNLILSQNKTLSLQDLTVLYSDILQASFSYQNMKAVTTTPTQVNVVSNNSSNTTASSVPGLIVEWSYVVELPDRFPRVEAQGKMFSLLVLSPDKNTGYVLYTAGNTPAAIPTIPQPVQQIFDSFELVR
jgi:hypothetical protein